MNHAEVESLSLQELDRIAALHSGWHEISELLWVHEWYEGHYTNPPEFSHDMLHAWLLAEYARTNGFSVTVECDPLDDKYAMWQAHIRDDCRRGEDRNELAPIAITRAFVLAMTDEEGE